MSDIDQRPPKRRRFDGEINNDADISSADHLHQILQFSQSSDHHARAAVNRFKDFLTNTAKNDDLAGQSWQLKILRQYCGQQASSSTDQIDFPDLLSTWSFAAQNDNDAILSAVPAALAQFFRTISSSLEFRDFGLSLIHTLLKRDQLRLLVRGLSAPKSKPHLISPCLRLLTEMTTFDGGALANRVWGKRDMLLKRFDTLLIQQSSTLNAEERRKPSTRRMALRFLHALLKFLDSNAKTELLSQGRALHVCLQGMKEDGDDIVVDNLVIIQKHIIDDFNIPKVAKLRFFNAANLFAVSSLYGYEAEGEQEGIEKVRNVANEFLIRLCTNRSGILLNHSGWYPPGTAQDSILQKGDNVIDLGLDAPTYFDDYSKLVPVKNTVLSTFVQSLQTSEDAMQTKLLLDIFRSAPELVASYLVKHTKFSTPSKDDTAWRSQFAVLFSIVQLPVPKNLGWLEGDPFVPPPLSIVIESVLPRPFDRITITKLLTSDDDTMQISGSRLMTVALGKLQSVLRSFAQYREENSALWRQASQRLVELFMTRAPLLKDLFTTLQHTQVEDDTVRIPILECLAAYHQLLPEATVGSKFDISPIMMDLISRLEQSNDSTEDYESLMQQLKYCVIIADLSPATKWLRKPDNDTMSPLGRLLRLSLANKERTESNSIISIVCGILEAKGILSSGSNALNALMSSLEASKKFSPVVQTFLFLDNCVCRTNQKPVKYLDDVESVQLLVSDKKPVSLLAACIVEQWDFAVNKYTGDKDVLKNISAWITRFYGALDAAGENFRVLSHFQDSMLESSGKKAKGYFEKALEKVRKKPVVLQNGLPELDKTDQKDTIAILSETTIATKPKLLDLATLFDVPASIPTSLEGLDRWGSNTDFGLEFHSGRLGKFLLCTSSPEEEIRRQTFQLLQSIAHSVDPAINRSSESTVAHDDEKGQLYLLLGELCETMRQHGLDTPLPTLVPQLGIHILSILVDPSHQLYGKVNRFLLRGPSWDIHKLISYWVDKILLHEPDSTAITADDAGTWTQEVNWLLQWLVDGLTTSADSEVYRRSGVWERVMSLYNKSAPALQRSSKKLILNQLWRGMIIEGGADTLWTRFGAYSWIDMMCVLETDDECKNILGGLKNLMEEKSDKAGIQAWKNKKPISKRDDGAIP